jgi:HAE1 family hydrophobic/amphiphilic exporter-1
MEHAGMSMREAILEAGATRLRPILMTAIATIGALIPLAVGAEGGGLISKGVGVTVIGGLISSTILTLVIVPLVYELISRILKKDRAHENKED